MSTIIALEAIAERSRLSPQLVSSAVVASSWLLFALRGAAAQMRAKRAREARILPETMKIQR